MDLLKGKTNKELVQSCVAELAKAQNEIRCAQRDVDKANRRLSFLLAVLNTINDRYKD
jgi:hypothetical protein